jgi:hypothetical protein
VRVWRDYGRLYVGAVHEYLTPLRSIDSCSRNFTSVTGGAAMAREPMRPRANQCEGKNYQSQKYAEFVPRGHLSIEVEGALVVEQS